MIVVNPINKIIHAPYRRYTPILSKRSKRLWLFKYLIPHIQKVNPDVIDNANKNPNILYLVSFIYIPIIKDYAS